MTEWINYYNNWVNTSDIDWKDVITNVDSDYSSLSTNLNSIDNIEVVCDSSLDTGSVSYELNSHSGNTSVDVLVSNVSLSLSTFDVSSNPNININVNSLSENISLFDVSVEVFTTVDCDNTSYSLTGEDATPSGYVNINSQSNNITLELLDAGYFTTVIQDCDVTSISLSSFDGSIDENANITSDFDTINIISFDPVISASCAQPADTNNLSASPYDSVSEALSDSDIQNQPSVKLHVYELFRDSDVNVFVSEHAEEIISVKESTGITSNIYGSTRSLLISCYDPICLAETITMSDIPNTILTTAYSIDSSIFVKGEDGVSSEHINSIIPSVDLSVFADSTVCDEELFSFDQSLIRADLYASNAGNILIDTNQVTIVIKQNITVYADYAELIVDLQIPDIILFVIQYDTLPTPNTESVNYDCTFWGSDFYAPVSRLLIYPYNPEKKEVYYLYTDLEYWFNKYYEDNLDIVTTNIPNKSSIYSYKPTIKNSIFSLMFNPTYSYSDYIYTFSTSDKVSYTGNKQISTRVRASKDNFEIYTVDTDGENILNLSEVDLQMIDLLLEFRTGTTVDLTTIQEDTLESKLSILIYKYIDAMQNMNTTYVSDSTTTITDYEDPPYLKMFELFVLNEIFKMIKNTSTEIGTYVRYLLKRMKFTLSTANVSSRTLSIDDYTPVATMNTSLYINGKYIDTSLYALNSTTITISNNVNILAGNIVIFDFYIEL